MDVTPLADHAPTEDPGPNVQNIIMDIASHFESVVDHLTRSGFKYHDAENAVQKALFTAWKCVKKGKRIYHPTGWLATSAWREAMKINGSNTKKKKIAGEESGKEKPKRKIRLLTNQEDLECVQCRVDEPQRTKKEEKQLSMILNAIENLKPLQREVFRFCILDEHSRKEAMQNFGLSYQAVHGYLCRAWMKLKLLRELDPDTGEKFI